jgi:plastocyanin
LSAKSGGQITIHFTNADPSTPHNVVVFNGQDATAPALFTGPAVTGPGSIDYTFAAPPPGRYFFHCQFHPTTMKGILTVT